MTAIPLQASNLDGMILAAGFGKRMRPLTLTLPKPMVEVAGKPLIDHVIARAEAVGIARLVVNVHHLAHKLEDHLAGKQGPEIVISDERDAILETGGGVRRALPHLQSDPFFIFNSDCLWVDGAAPLIPQMLRQWDPERMDMLLALAPTVTSTGYSGAGDFELLQDGALRRRSEAQIAPFVYMGVALVRPTVFDGTPEGAFSLNLIFDRLLERGRLHGVRLNGFWMHVGTPDAIDEAERAIANSKD